MMFSLPSKDRTVRSEYGLFSLLDCVYSGKWDAKSEGEIFIFADSFIKTFSLVNVKLPQVACKEADKRLCALLSLSLSYAVSKFVGVVV